MTTVIRQDDLIESVADALQFISYYHPKDFIQGVYEAYQKEESQAAKDAMAQILINSRMCAQGHRPICQDTGIVTVFVNVGMNVQWDCDMPLDDVINEGVRRAYTHPDNDWQYGGIESLSELTLLAINGYAYSPVLNRYIERHQDDPERVWILSGPAPLSRAIELLHQQRSDVFPEDRYVMNWQLQQEGDTESLRMAAVIHESPIYVAFSPVGRDSTQLAALLSEGARALQRSGRVSEILARYGVSWSD